MEVHGWTSYKYREGRSTVPKQEKREKVVDSPPRKWENTCGNSKDDRPENQKDLSSACRGK